MRRQHVWLLAILLVIVAGGWIAYRRASGAVEKRIEQQVAAALPSKIGPGTDYKVTASAGLAGMTRGTISSISIQGQDVELKSGVRLRQLDTTLRGIHVDRKKRAITGIDSAEFTASISEPELNAFLARRYPDLPDREIVLRDGYLTVSATPTVRGATAHVEADASLEVEAPDRIVLRARQVKAGNLAAPSIARQYLEEKLNPVLSLSDWGFKGQLKSVTITPDAITLSGTGQLPGMGL